MARDEDQRELDEIRRAAFELRGRDPNEAVKVLRRAVRKGGAWEALAHGALGEILLDDFDDVDAALHHFEKLQKLAPGLPAAEPGLRRVPIAPSEVAGLEEILNQEGDLRTLPCHLPNADPRLGGLDGFFAARLVKS